MEILVILLLFIWFIICLYASENYLINLLAISISILITLFCTDSWIGIIWLYNSILYVKIYLKYHIHNISANKRYKAERTIQNYRIKHHKKLKWYKKSFPLHTHMQIF